MPFRKTVTEIPKIDVVLWGIFSRSFRNCAGGKLGTTKVQHTTSRNATANTILGDMSSENVADAFFVSYESGVLTEKSSFQKVIPKQNRSGFPARFLTLRLIIR